MVGGGDRDFAAKLIQQITFGVAGTCRHGTDEPSSAFIHVASLTN
jgi:hypothetical protein